VKQYVIGHSSAPVPLTGDPAAGPWASSEGAAIDEFPWYQGGERQGTTVRLLQDAEALYLQFLAADRHISSRVTELNGPVCTDSCVELFATIDPPAGAYYEVVKDQLPQADIVFDKFHLIANYHAVIDEVRREEWRKASAEDKDVIKGQRYNLFRNPANRTSAQTQSLMKLLHMNRNLAVMHILKDALRKVWDYQRMRPARKYLAKWCRWAAVSGIEALRKFGRSLLKAKAEVLNFVKHHITTAPLESFNNTVSRILHRACGIRSLDYLFLKLRQESLETDQRK